MRMIINSWGLGEVGEEEGNEIFILLGNEFCN